LKIVLSRFNPLNNAEEVRAQQKRAYALAPISIAFFQHTKEIRQIAMRQDLLDSFGNSSPLTRRPPISPLSWYFTAEPTPLLGELIEVTGLGYPHLRKRSRIMVAAATPCGGARSMIGLAAAIGY
jgi:hypothetical protein